MPLISVEGCLQVCEGASLRVAAGAPHCRGLQCCEVVLCAPLRSVVQLPVHLTFSPFQFCCISGALTSSCCAGHAEPRPGPHPGSAVAAALPQSSRCSHARCRAHAALHAACRLTLAAVFPEPRTSGMYLCQSWTLMSTATSTNTVLGS